MFSAEEQAGPTFTDALARTWWPAVALAAGVLLIVAGGVLFSA